MMESAQETLPLIVGLSGGIGVGKSFVAQRLIRAGVPVFDCDTVAKRAYVESETVRSRVLSLLGTESYTSEQKPDYRWIASRVFSDPSLLRQLESIIYPFVAEQLFAWRERQDAPRQWVAMESATLWSSRFYQYCDAVIEVSAPLAVRIARVQQRDGATIEQIEARLAQQQTISVRERQMDYPDLPIMEIVNDGKRDIDEQVVDVLHRLSDLHVMSSRRSK